MVGKASIIIALACAGLSSVAAGVVIRTTGHAGSARADRVAPWGKLSAPSASVGTVSADRPESVKPVRPAQVPADAAAVTTVTEAVPAAAEQTVAVISPDVVKAAAVAPTADPTPAPTAVPIPRDTAPTPRSDDRTASVEPSPPAAAVPRTAGSVDAGAPAGTLVDINTASVAALNGLPGVGRIGRAIASHRPYRSLDELTSRRVLRGSDFNRVKDKLKV